MEKKLVCANCGSSKIHTLSECVRPYLDGIKVGDKVWSVEFGWCAVTDYREGAPYPICVNVLPTQCSELVGWFNLSGFRNIVQFRNQSLFWDEVKIVPPPRPKRTRKAKDPAAKG